MTEAMSLGASLTIPGAPRAHGAGHDAGPRNMLSFMDYVTQAFSTGTNWNTDNSYSSLTTTARALLDFLTPHGLSLTLSSLSSPISASSYTLRSTGPLTGSVSYLYTSLPLSIPHASATLPLPALVPGHWPLAALRRPDEAWWWETWRAGRRVDRRDVLLYGRLYLPASRLEALYLRRPSPTTLLKVAAVSTAPRPNSGSHGALSEPSGSMLVSLARDTAKYSAEGLLSLDGMVLGARGLYNFGPDPRTQPHLLDGSSPSSGELSRPRQPSGRFSAGAEVYYGVLNKSGGMSTGVRFATLPRSPSGSAGGSGGVAPYVMTLTLNPLMGNLSSTYAVRAGPALALCSRFDFNFYSYESGFTAGLELWRRTARSDSSPEGGYAGRAATVESTNEEGGIAGNASTSLEMAAGGMAMPKEGQALEDFRSWRPEDTAGVLKARMKHDGETSVLWEGRAKELLYSFGFKVDFKQREQIFRGVGLEFQYSS